MHCEAEGGDYDGIEKTVLAVRPVLADVDAFLAGAGEYAALGVTEVLTVPDRPPVGFAERVLPRLTAVGWFGMGTRCPGPDPSPGARD